VFLGSVLFIIGFWMFISPQSILGLKELKWMYQYAFPGEILVGSIVLSLAYYLIDFKVNWKK